MEAVRSLQQSEWFNGFNLSTQTEWCQNTEHEVIYTRVPRLIYRETRWAYPNHWKLANYVIELVNHYHAQQNHYIMNHYFHLIFCVMCLVRNSTSSLKKKLSSIVSFRMSSELFYGYTAKMFSAIKILIMPKKGAYCIWK